MKEIRTLSRELALCRRLGRKPLNLRVRCSGHYHTIRYDGKGRFKLLDHSRREVQLQFAFQERGGTVCRCVQVWLGWNQRFHDPFRSVNLPPFLQAEYRHAKKVRAKRKRLKQLANDFENLSRERHCYLRGLPWYQQPGFLADFLVRLLRRSCGLPEDVQGKCWLRKKYYTFILEIGDRVLLDVVIQPDWIDQVYRKGLALIRGALTLGIEKRPGRAALLLTQCRPVTESGGKSEIVIEKSLVVRGRRGLRVLETWKPGMRRPLNVPIIAGAAINSGDVGREITTDDAFMRAILDSPHDEAPRLAYAAELDKRSDPRGKFICLQYQLDRMEAADPRTLAVWESADALLRAHRREWEGPLAEWTTFRWFARGFIWCIGITARNFLCHAASIFRLAPVICVYLKDAERHLAEVVAMPELDKITALHLDGNRLNDADAAILASGCHFQGLKVLDLSGNQLSDQGVATLAASPNFPGLRVLNLGATRLTVEGVWTLANSTALGNLQSLVLSNNQLDSKVSRALAACAGLRHLRELDLSYNHIREAGARIIGEARVVKHLDMLDLSHNRIHNTGALGLAQSEIIGRQTELRLQKNPIGEKGKAMLVRRFGRKVRV